MGFLLLAFDLAAAIYPPVMDSLVQQLDGAALQPLSLAGALALGSVHVHLLVLGRRLQAHEDSRVCHASPEKE